MNPELKLIILESAIEESGIYCASTIDKNGIETKRTPWQDGYNEAVTTIYKNQTIIREYFKTLDEKDQEVIAKLMSGDGDLRLNINQNKEVKLWINCSDVFAWACADGEDIR